MSPEPGPFLPRRLLFMLGLTLWLVLSIKLEIIALTFAKLGLDPGSALTLLMTSLFGSAINLPLFTIRTSAPPEAVEPAYRELVPPPAHLFSGQTRVAVNVGGCLVPLFFSWFLLQHNAIASSTLILAVAVVAAVSYGLSRPIAGLGIAMPILVAPITAALAAIVLGGEQRAALAYIAGSLGVLIGADLLRLKDIRHLGAPLASIGGAGTFDGIFMTGLVAVLLT
ncbi:MAG: DUF1614 domain-containing protein, partial [Methylococcaceae bacterium]|nr:DUF1614 domain-containing protein [Methylococcaceae bacterium]